MRNASCASISRPSGRPIRFLVRCPRVLTAAQHTRRRRAVQPLATCGASGTTESTMPICPSVSCQVIDEHLTACRPCAALLAYSRRVGDCAALVSWRELLATHLANEEERRVFANARRISSCSPAPLLPSPTCPCCAVRSVLSFKSVTIPVDT